MTSDNIIQDPVKLEDLNYFWTKAGVPCFMADRPDIEDIVESLGYTIYYLICNVAEDRKIETKEWVNGKQETKTTYVTDLSTSIVKVVNNLVARSVSVIDEEELYDFAAVREQAIYNLPLIPHVIVEKLDEFFRLVDAQHGTESIVLLTFDPTKNDSSGWGVLVPEQVNTSVHCKYDPDSIVDQKPDHVMIVGSVHSHPNMAAYASGTDHADQADFDGIHITYGWQKSVNSGATQYHIELQSSGKTFTLKPEDVFEQFIPLKEPDPDVIQWSNKVKKAFPPQGGSYLAQSKDKVTPLPTDPHTPAITQLGYTPHGTTKGDPRLQSFPEIKEDSSYLVICEVDYSSSGTVECPSCGFATLTHASGFPLHDFCCECCDALLTFSNDDFSTIIDRGIKYLKLRKLETNIPFYLWSQTDNGDLLMRVKEKDYSDSDSSTSLLEDNYNYYDTTEYDKIAPDPSDGFDETYSVCCAESLIDRMTCSCGDGVYYEDVIRFDQAHPADIYDRNSDCISCEYYYSRLCKPYLESIIDFARKEIKLNSPIVECQDYLPYTKNYHNTY